jgi:hypothetical protein
MSGNIYTALAVAQQEFGSVQKGSVNPAFKSKYADLADVASVVIPTLARHGVAVIHYIDADGKAMVTAFVHGESGTRVECPVPLIVNKQDMQAYKSATTYAKRIGLESLSGVAPEDDDGNADAAARPQAARPAPQSARPAPQGARPAYDQARFEQMLPRWAEAIAKGQTADAVIAKIQSAFTLTTQQLEQLRAAEGRAEWLAQNAGEAA